MSSSARRRFEELGLELLAGDRTPTVAERVETRSRSPKVLLSPNLERLLDRAIERGIIPSPSSTPTS